MGADNIGLDLHVELKEPIVHFLKPREIAWQGTEAIAKKTLDIALAVELVMAPAVAVGQSNPVHSVTLCEKSVVLRSEEAGNPAQRASLHSFNRFVECVFDCAIENTGIFEGHTQRLVSHELLQGRFADAIVEQRNGKGVPEAMRG